MASLGLPALAAEGADALPARPRHFRGWVPRFRQRTAQECADQLWR